MQVAATIVPVVRAVLVGMVVVVMVAMLAADILSSTSKST
jgi:hypothetical protein